MMGRKSSLRGATWADLQRAIRDDAEGSSYRRINYKSDDKSNTKERLKMQQENKQKRREKEMGPRAMRGRGGLYLTTRPRPRKRDYSSMRKQPQSSQ
ncbi:hypothetical protein QJS04_geneDACA022327 [Acorus gramineus]|uniref:Uncharacterized protein n=1 Tax=Acorus gramineus TaxID=55184 RepID=A0AAV9AIR3_ACOGR|nr:hypothetical protein QJS04_geneDACA022327 [Acorus gramineus]